MSKDLFIEEKDKLAYYINTIQKEHSFSEYSTIDRMQVLLEIRFQIKASKDQIENIIRPTLEEEDELLMRKHAGLWN